MPKNGFAIVHKVTMVLQQYLVQGRTFRHEIETFVRMSPSLGTHRTTLVTRYALVCRGEREASDEWDKLE